MRDLTTKGFYRLLSMLAPLFALALSGCYEKPNTAEAKRPPVPVVLATAEKQDIRITVRLTGKTNTDPVKIVPRVRGYIESINFKPGDIVKEGDVLYEIEKFDYQNKLDVAIASRDKAVADVEKTKADYDRDLALQQQGQGFTTQADIDRDKALFDEAKANLASAEADIEMAKKELERCTIKATVTGLISRTKIAEGNMVDGTSGTETVLTDIAPMDPMYVYFQITDSVFNNFMASLRKQFKELLGDQFDDTIAYDNETISKIAKEHGLEGTISISVGMRDDVDEQGNQNYPYTGILDYSDNHVDVATGTITVRGTLDNHDYMIYPGNICNVQFPGKEIPGAVLVEERAICHDLSDTYVWMIGADGKPTKRSIELGQQYTQELRIVTSGLQGGEKYVLEGTLKVSEGCDITEDIPNADTAAPAAASDAPAAQQPAAPADSAASADSAAPADAQAQ